ncbi:MAG: hypothetical protein ABJM43_14605 [Paracoccaceae bacterium]
MLSYSSETGWVFDPSMCVLVVLAVGFQVYRSRVRKSSLHQREDGVYVWIEWHGAERSSICDPSLPGGEGDCDGGD